MHEVFLTRGDVPQEKQDAIMVPQNCALLHSKCHHAMIGHGGETEYVLCAVHLIQMEGWRSIKNWLDDMTLITKIAGNQALRRFTQTFMEELYATTIR